METPEILNQLQTIFRSVMDNEDIQLTDTTTAIDVEEWDSITHIQLIVAVEKFFKIKFNAAEIRAFKNVGELASTIKSKLA